MTTTSENSHEIEVMVRSASAAISQALEKEKKNKAMAKQSNRLSPTVSKVSRRPGTPTERSAAGEKPPVDKSKANVNRLAQKKAEEESASFNTVRHRNGKSRDVPPSPRALHLPRTLPSPRQSPLPRAPPSPRTSRTAARKVMSPTNKGPETLIVTLDKVRTDVSNVPQSMSLTSSSTNSRTRSLPYEKPLSQKSPIETKMKNLTTPRRSNIGDLLNKMFRGKQAMKRDVSSPSSVASTADEILKDLSDFHTPETSPERLAMNRSERFAAKEREEAVRSPKKVM